jgi:CxxC-x17-CxxC domain-containing protein
MSSEYTSDTTGSDQTLQCRDCGQDFVFTAGEQSFYASRGFTHPPTRCPDCRAARKAQERGGSYGGQRAPREMFTAICANCGREAQVPFQPRDDRPVYCSDCYQPRATSGGGGGGRSSGGRSNDRGGSGGGRRERW